MHDLETVLASLYPRDAMILVQSPTAVLYVALIDGELCATDAGSFAKTYGEALDTPAAEAVCSEWGCDWAMGVERPWIVARVTLGMAVIHAVEAVENALAALTAAVEGCKVTSGEECE